MIIEKNGSMEERNMKDREEKRSGLGKMNFNRISVIIIALFMITSLNAGLIGGLEYGIEDPIMAGANPGPVPANDMSRQSMELEDVWYPENNGLGTFLLGTGQIMGLTGGMIDVNHPDLRDGAGARVTQIGSIAYYAPTFYAGAMIGNGFCYETVEGLPTGDNYYNGYAGMCPQGELIAGADFGTGDWDAMIASGARVIANPWGPAGTPAADYDSNSQTTDSTMNANPTTLMIFPTGYEGPRPLSISGGGNSWCGLSVGGSEGYHPEYASLSDDPNTLWEGTSRGPMITGRIKPDIAAPATNVISTKSSLDSGDAINDIPGYNYYNTLTSDYSKTTASGIKLSFVAGSASLIRQYLIDVEGMGDPNAVLVKAIMLNGAEDVGYGYPSYQDGWGRVNVKNSICPDAPRTNQWAEGNLATGQTWDISVDGGANTYIESDRVPLKVMVCWDMPAGNSMSNDYELEVVSPSGIVYKGNCFDQVGDNDDWSHPDPDAAFWDSLGSPTAAPYGFDYDTDDDNDDDINNVEAVFVEKPEVGQWTVTIRSDSTPDAPNFAVVWGADTGVQEDYHVQLNIDNPTTMECSQGGTLAFPLDILNFGTEPDSIQFSDDADADLTVTYSDTSPMGMDSNTEKNVIAQITASPTAAIGIHQFTITAESLFDITIPAIRDSITITVDIIGSGLPLAYQVTDSKMSQSNPSVIAFTNATGVDCTLIAYASEEGKDNGNRVFVSHTTDDLTTGTATWTHSQVSTQADVPEDIRITHMPGGTYQDRVFISWHGWDPSDFTDWGGYWAYSAWADPPYTTWNPVKAASNSDNPAYDDDWRDTMVCCRESTDEVIMIIESIYYLGGSFAGFGTFAKTSTDGGATWGGFIQISPADGNMYYRPNAFVDKLDNVVVYFYYRSIVELERDLYFIYYDGSWNPGVIVDTTDNCMFPVGTATSEGASSNRWYCFFTRSVGTTNTQRDGWIMYSDDLGASWSALNGPLGTDISDVDYGFCPILDIDATEEGGTTYIWSQYLEKTTTFDFHNIDNPVSDDGFTSWGFQNVTQDSYSKGHQSGDSLGEYMYQTYHSYSKDLETGNMDVWLRVYKANWESEIDVWGPQTLAVSVNPNPAGQGWPIEITANINDISTGYSDIAAAEWCEGTVPSWPGTLMSPYDGTFDNPTEGVIATGDTTGWSFGEHTIWVRGQDSEGNWGEPAFVTIEILDITMAPDVTLTYPNTVGIIESGTITIAWNAIDAEDLLDNLFIYLNYSDDGGNTWSPIASGLINDASGSSTYIWAAGVPDGVNYKIMVEALDSSNKKGNDSSFTAFSIDNIVDDEWFFQVDGPFDLNMMPVEILPQFQTTAGISGTGPVLVGAWTTTSTYLTSNSIDGLWTFDVYGYMSDPSCTGRLFAQVYSGATLLDTTIADDTDVTDTSAFYTWTDNLVGNIAADGDAITVEVWLDVTSGGGGGTGSTLNPDFTTDTANWAFSMWEDTGSGTVSGSWNGAAGNPPGSADIVFTAATTGGTSEQTYSGYWEQAFTTGLVPSSATLDFDWSCLDIGAGDRNMAAYVFIDTISGAPTLGSEIWTSGTITSTSSWAAVNIDVSGVVNADTTYYLKLAFRDTNLEKNEGQRQLAFDNAEVTWDSPSPTFTMEYDYGDTQSSVSPTLNTGPIPPYDIDLDGAIADDWVFVSFPITATGDVMTVFDDLAWGDGN
ncbi:MAG: S8 family serine peptidase, partial [Thermoplasmata archaeon]|nr:S8 family serine peptidase [Thermoplasmata archaeon]